MSPQETFITRLRRHRQRNAISLDHIAGETRVKRELLDAFEQNDLSQWPRGLYARAWVRAYAVAVGLDPVDTVDEFCRLFPHGDRRANTTLREMAEIVSQPSEYRDDFEHPEDRRHAGEDAGHLPASAWPAPLAQGARSLWQRMTNAASPQARPRRTPRTSS